MKSGNPSTKQELESAREKLIQQIEDAEGLFGAEQNAPELLTLKAALKGIEQLLRSRRMRQKRDVA